MNLARDVTPDKARELLGEIHGVLQALDSALVNDSMPMVVIARAKLAGVLDFLLPPGDSKALKL